jgi:asparagine synthase (glutamine-hydrolysing)
MFAIAVWDKFEKSLFLARDRMGIKPLYIWRWCDGLAFASEVKALRALPGGPQEINPEAVAQFLAWGSVPQPITIFRDVECLGPATWALWRGGELGKHTYWNFPAGPVVYRRREEAAEVLRPLLAEAVKLRCIADVPVGAFLSGGVDSSSVVGLMRAAGQQDLRTFSISFPQTQYDEGPYAVKVAEQFGTLHTDVSVTEQMVRAELDGFFGAMDQPTSDGVNSYLVSQFTHQAGIKVSLSGLGGDELFAGYPTFRRAARMIPWLRYIPGQAFRLATSVAAKLDSRGIKLEALGLPGDEMGRIYFSSRGLFMPSEIKDLLDPGFWSENESTMDLHFASNSADTIHNTILLELRRYMHNQLLRDSDVFGMAHSLEIRVPLIDHLLVETLFRIDGKLILRRSNKGLLLESLPAPLPRLCTDRPKMGFTFPFDTWMKNPWARMLETTFSEASSSIRGRSFMRIDRARKVLHDYQAGNVHWSRPWSLYVLLRYLATQSNMP